MAKRKKEEAVGRLLVVDDNEMNRDMLSRRLTRRGHTVDVAEGGQQALDMIAAASTRSSRASTDGPYDLVLLDIMMPGVDGMAVLDEVRLHTDAQTLPIIMATAKTETEDVVDALKRGANDYVTKPLDFPVVLARVRTQLALKRAHDQLAAAHHRMKRDLDAAARCQQALLPKSPPACDSVEVAWRYQPCDELGGDALNVFMIDEHTLCLYLLDASGHGVPASLLSVSAARALSPGAGSQGVGVDQDADGLRLADPRTVASRLNAMFPMADNGDHYFTLIYGLLDTRTGLFRFISPGAPGPLHISHNGEVKAVDAPGLPIGMAILDSLQDKDGGLGVLENGEGLFDLCEIQLKPGDRLLLYSDGVNEELGADNNEQYGRDRLLTAASETADMPIHQSLDTLTSGLREWHGSDQFSDDVSFLCVAWQAQAK